MAELPCTMVELRRQTWYHDDDRKAKDAGDALSRPQVNYPLLPRFRIEGVCDVAFASGTYVATTQPAP